MCRHALGDDVGIDVVGKQGDVCAPLARKAIPTADLVDIILAGKVAVAFVNLEVRDGVAGPAFAVVLGAAVRVVAASAGLDTHVCRKAVVAEQ